MRIETATIHLEIKEVMESSVRLGRLLGQIGAIADAAVAACSARAPTKTLRGTAAQIGSLVLHALVVVAELQACAGRLDQLAAVLEAELPDQE